MGSAGEALVDVLVRGGVRRLYCVPGESYLEVLDAADARDDIRLVSTRHESSAAFMAEADAKLTGVPAVAAATRGPGAGNLAVGVHTAYQDSTPMVVLVGQVSTAHMEREAFQEMDLPTFFRPMTKWAATVHRADRVPELARHALHVASTGRPGPVMLALPADVMAETVEVSAHQLADLPFVRPTPAPSASELERLADLLAHAERPVLIAGGGARNARAELVELAERGNYGVYAGFRRQDVFPNDHPLYLGHLGLGTPDDVLASLRQADLVVVIGSRLSEITTQAYTLPAVTSRVVQIDVDEASMGGPGAVELRLLADAGEALRGMLAGDPRPCGHDFSGAHAAHLRSSTIPADASGSGVDPAQVIAAMRDVVAADAIVTNDAGNFAAYLHRYWSYVQPRSQLAPTSGAMGYGVPAAVAAKIAAPDRTVVSLAGDGGFLMTGVEVETAVREGLDLTVVVFRNGLYGTIAMHQAKAFGRTSAVSINDVDIAMIARGYGANGHSVTSGDQLHDALEKAVDEPGVSVVDVVTDPELISPTARMSQLLAGGT